MHQYSWAQPSARRPPTACGGSVITGPRGASCPPARTHVVGPGTGKSGGEPSTIPTPPRSRSKAPSKLHGVRPASVRGIWWLHCLENPTAKALWAQPSARRPPAALGGSVITIARGASHPPACTHAVGPGTGNSGGEPSMLTTLQRSRLPPFSLMPMVTSLPRKSHAHCRARNGEERGRTQHDRNPATLPLKSPQQATWHSPRFSQGPMVASPPRKSHSESFMGPALGRTPTRGPWGFHHHGTSRRQSPTHAVGPGTGKSGGRPYPLATSPCSRSRAPSKPHGVRPASVRCPHRKSHSQSFVGQTWGPALGTAPARGLWGFRHHGTSRRQSPTSAHARCRAGNGEERGRTQKARNPATLPLKSPQQAASRQPRLSQGPMVCYSRRPLPTGRGPYRSTRSVPTPWSPPYSRLVQREPAKTEALLPSHFGRGGEMPPPLPFSKALCGVPRPTPRVALAGEDERMGGEEGTGDSIPGCNYVVRGYSPSMHFFWGGDMAHYSPHLPFRLARGGCPCMLASPLGCPARGSRTVAAETAPHFLPVCAPLLVEFFNFLTDISV